MRNRERIRAAHVRLGTIEVELERLRDRESDVVARHEQAYLIRIHRYSAARTSQRSAMAAALADPPFTLPPVATTVDTHLFDYLTAA